MMNKIIEWIKINRIKVFILVVFSAVLTLLYVDNTIKINELLKKNQEHKTEILQIKNNQEILKARIVQLKSVERITKIAEEKLGMTKPKKIPVVIEIEAEKK